MQPDGPHARYAIQGEVEASGLASIVLIRPNVYSILLGTDSFTVHLSKADAEYEVWCGDRRLFVSIADARDRPVREGADQARGPVEVRSQMPGKIIALLVARGAEIKTGDG